jgi:Ca2+ transporting ATPase
MCDEAAMTGESDHLPKESVEKCLNRKVEFEAENNGQKGGSHDLPSPILLSGT